jgi:triosephosphate isomerase
VRERVLCAEIHLYTYPIYNILSHPEVVIAPPAIHLIQVKDLLSSTPHIEVSGQNAYHKISGAFTGEVSVSQLEDAGIPWVILGHSERRTIFNESNKEIAEKTQAALDHNLKVIICVGETLEEREKNESINVVVGQLDAVVGSVKDWRCVEWMQD